MEKEHLEELQNRKVKEKSQKVRVKEKTRIEFLQFCCRSIHDILP